MATLKDVAAEAGVSISLVSHYLNDRPGVGAKSRERIEAAIEKLSYRPNGIARSLVRQKTDTIGVVVSNLCNPFIFDLLNGMDEAAEEKKYNVIYCSAGGSLEKKQRYMHLFADGRVDAMLIYGAFMEDDQLIRRLTKTHFPFALVENDLPDAGADQILIDNFDAGYRATKHLIELGHRRVAYMAGHPHLKVALERFRGYRKALEESGIPYTDQLSIQLDIFSESSQTEIENCSANFPSVSRQEYFEAAYRSMGHYLQENPLPDALFCSGDILAFGAIKALSERGIHVPEHVSIIGFDDEKSLEFGLDIPQITTMRQPLHQAGYLGVTNLIRRIEHPDTPVTQTVLRAELVERGSCRPKT